MTVKRIDARSLAARLKAGEATLVDIREPDEHAAERIAGAVSAPLSGLGDRLSVTPRAVVVFHCLAHSASSLIRLLFLRESRSLENLCAHA